MYFKKSSFNWLGKFQNSWIALVMKGPNTQQMTSYLSESSICHTTPYPAVRMRRVINIRAYFGPRWRPQAKGVRIWVRQRAMMMTVKPRIFGNADRKCAMDVVKLLQWNMVLLMFCTPWIEVWRSTKIHHNLSVNSFLQTLSLQDAARIIVYLKIN